MPEFDQPAPNPAEPTLASNLLELEERHRRRFAGRGERIGTSCMAVDGSVLGGGLERGIVLGISADGPEGRLVSEFFMYVYYRCGVINSSTHGRKFYLVTFNC